MATADLTTLDAVKRILKIASTDTEADGALSALITATSADFVRACGGRGILNASYTQAFDGDGRRKKLLDDCPVVSVESVKVNDQDVPARPSSTGDGYVISEKAAGELTLVGYAFGYGVANCVVQYTAGYGATVPPDVDRAVAEWVAWRYREEDRQGEVSRNVGGEVVTFSQYPMPMSTKSVVERYARWG